MTGLARAGWFDVADEVVRADVLDVQPFRGERVTLSRSGHAIPLAWRGVDGASDVAIARAEVRLRGVEHPLDLDRLELRDGAGYRFATIGSHRRARSLTLGGLRMVRDSATVTVGGRADLGGHSRLVVLIEDPLTGRLVARYASPGLSGGSFTGPILPEVPFAGGVIALPDVATGRVGVAIVDAGEHDLTELSARAIMVDQVSAVALEVASELQLHAGGRPLWSSVELAPGETIAVDFRVALTGLWRTALAGRAPLATELVLTGSRGRVDVDGPDVEGVLLRRAPGVMRLALAGEPAPMPVGTLPAEQPARVHADVSFRYGAVRLLAGASDAPPPPGRPIEGLVIGDRPYLHTFAPGAIAGLPLARVALYGRAPEPCELSITPVELSSGMPRPIGPPGVASLAASARMGFAWVPMAGSTAPEGAGLLVRANRGRFLWAASPAPLVRVAVHDEVAGGRTVTLDGQPICEITSTAKQVAIHASFPRRSFTGTAPSLDSDLFVTFDIADLTMEYAR